jgi:hypothetical protein
VPVDPEEYGLNVDDPVEVLAWGIFSWVQDEDRPQEDLDALVAASGLNERKIDLAFDLAATALA